MELVQLQGCLSCLTRIGDKVQVWSTTMRATKMRTAVQAMADRAGWLVAIKIIGPGLIEVRRKRRPRGTRYMKMPTYDPRNPRKRILRPRITQ
jgi:hypothetical protein